MTKDRRIFIALIVSMVANLALVAYIVGSHLATHRLSNSADPSYALAALARSLPEERIEELMPGYIERIRADVRPHYRKLREAQARLHRELTKRDVNREAIEAAIDDHWIARHSAQRVADTVFVELYIQLSEKERREVTSALLQVRARHDEWRRSRLRRAEEEREQTERNRGDDDVLKEQSDDP